MEKVQRGHVEGRRHHHPATALHQSQGEVEPGLPVVETAVDMGGGDVQQTGCVFGLTHREEQLHSGSGCLAALSVEHRLVRFGELHSGTDDAGQSSKGSAICGSGR